MIDNELKKLWKIAIKKGKFQKNYLTTALMGSGDTAILEVYQYKLPRSVSKKLDSIYETDYVEVPKWFVDKVRKVI